ncbi:hypothetical protein BLNAU_9806 [Blattamonas nauphoetae]|uniref:Uncharacterized protein n=1 Tax=Blattamonas nauphoetae TaxID=2049346 RepID=A0ABQ9XUU9_9EUKA|nr:hypothetical protein BLNAU_9806 [Blattamonas nauphoetae]
MCSSMSKKALTVLSTKSKSDSETRPFLRTHCVPSDTTGSSSELVPFTKRLCSTLVEHVSEMKSLFAESSPSDRSASAPSVTLPDESPLFSRNTVLEVLCEGFYLLDSLLLLSNPTLHDILIDCDFVPLLKSTIITCLDLLEQPKTDSICPPSDRTAMLLTILNISWNCLASSLLDSHESLHPIVESAFSDIPQLCSLLERTCRHSSPNSQHLRMIINLACNHPHFVPRMLEENLIERVINTSKPMAVPTQRGQFHMDLIWVILHLVGDPICFTKDKEEWKRNQKLQLERALKPSKPCLLFILLREEFIPNDISGDRDLLTQITYLLGHTLQLERDLFEDGEIVETGREEWEVGWLVEKTNEYDMNERLYQIWRDDEKMIRNEKARWKKRVERQREAGHEDAVEGWLTRSDYETKPEIDYYFICVNEESGMNTPMWEWY